MLGSPARSRHGGAALVVVLAATLIAALPGAAVPARAAVRAAVAVAAVPDPRVSPGTLEFEGIDPGTTEVRTATVTTDAPDGAAVVRVVVSGTGELAPYLTTQVDVCAVAWTDQGCSSGAVQLLAGSVGAGVDTALDVPVPQSGIAYLRVGLTVDSTAPANAASTVRYELHLLAPDLPSPTPAPPAPPPDGAGAPISPVSLPTTGAEVAALVAAALALVALGLTLRTWGRERRRARSAGWTS